jgi:hypothetical protein
MSKKLEDAIGLVQIDHPYAAPYEVGKNVAIFESGVLLGTGKDEYDAWLNAATQIAERDRKHMEALYLLKSGGA